MGNLLIRIGRTAIKVLVKALATVCTAVLSVIEKTGGTDRKGGK